VHEQTREQRIAGSEAGAAEGGECTESLCQKAEGKPEAQLKRGKKLFRYLPETPK
jgi:hypothetical protein